MSVPSTPTCHGPPRPRISPIRRGRGDAGGARAIDDDAVGDPPLRDTVEGERHAQAQVKAMRSRLAWTASSPVAARGGGEDGPAPGLRRRPAGSARHRGARAAAPSGRRRRRSRRRTSGNRRGWRRAQVMAPQGASAKLSSERRHGAVEAEDASSRSGSTATQATTPLSRDPVGVVQDQRRRAEAQPRQVTTSAVARRLAQGVPAETGNRSDRPSAATGPGVQWSCVPSAGASARSVRRDGVESGGPAAVRGDEASAFALSAKGTTSSPPAAVAASLPMTKVAAFASIQLSAPGSAQDAATPCP